MFKLIFPPNLPHYKTYEEGHFLCVNRLEEIKFIISVYYEKVRSKTLGLLSGKAIQ